MTNIQTTLQGIRVENGYANTLQAVERVLQQGQSNQPPMAIVLEGDDDVVNSEEAAQSVQVRALQVGIVLVVQQDTDVDAQSASTVMNSLIADVQKALQVDYQRGGLALDTREIGISAVQIDEGMPQLVSTLAYRIGYRHRWTDPTQAL